MYLVVAVPVLLLGADVSRVCLHPLTTAAAVRAVGECVASWLTSSPLLKRGTSQSKQHCVWVVCGGVCGVQYRTCQHCMPAWCSQSMNLKASPPSSPIPWGPGREVGCRMTPARLPLCQSGMLESSLYAAPSRCPTLLALGGAAAAAFASARTTTGRLRQELLGCRRNEAALRCCRCGCCCRADDSGT